MYRTALLLAFCAAVFPLAIGCAAMKMPSPNLPGIGDSSAPVGSSQQA
jgi:hypothetical protein